MSLKSSKVPNMVGSDLRKEFPLFFIQMNDAQDRFIRVKNAKGTTPKRRIFEAGNKIGKCVTYSTLISTPDGEVPIGRLFEIGKPFKVYAWDGRKKVVAEASAPFKKDGLHRCYRMEMSDGRWIEAADNHRILCSDGNYHFVSDIYNAFHSRSLGFHMAGTAKAYKICKGVCFKMPFMTKGFVRDNVMHMDKFVAWFNEALLTYALVPFTRFMLCLFPRVPPVFPSPASPIGMVNSGGLVMREPNIPTFVTTEPGNSLPIFKNNGGFSAKLASYWNGRPNSLTSDFPLVHSDSSFFQAIIRTCKFSFMRIMGEGPTTYNTNSKQRTFSWSGHKGNIQHNHVDVNSINNIIKITPIGMQEVYDFSVANFHNYLAGGLVHHNTWCGLAEDLAHMMGFRPWLQPSDPDYLIEIKVPCIGMIGCETYKHSVAEKIEPMLRFLTPSICQPVFKPGPTGVLNILTLPFDCMGKKCGSKLFIRSYDEDASAFEGIDFDFLHWDEPPPFKIFLAAERGKVVTNAPSWFTMTPLKEPWIFEKLTQRAMVHA